MTYSIPILFSVTSLDARIVLITFSTSCMCAGDDATIPDADRVGEGHSTTRVECDRQVLYYVA